MCRVLTYLGKPILVEDLLYKPDNSFVKQSYHPIYMPQLLNLAGFGLFAWENDSVNPDIPFVYKTDELPFYDKNLRRLTKKIMSSCLLTHIRGVPYTENKIVSKQNVHPFIFPNTNIALAHNGSLYGFEKMKYDLLEYISNENKKYILGTTDSEWIYAVFLSQLENMTENDLVNNIFKAITETFSIIKKIRYKHNIRVNSPLNLFISNGEFIAATRFVLDYGWQPLNHDPTDAAHFNYHSLWYTYGENYEFESEDNEYKMKEGMKRSSIIISSEPLTEDTTTWIEVPEYTTILAYLAKGEVEIVSYDLNI